MSNVNVVKWVSHSSKFHTNDEYTRMVKNVIRKIELLERDIQSIIDEKNSISGNDEEELLNDIYKDIIDTVNTKFDK